MTSRRTFLTLTGAAAVAATGTAGCLDQITEPGPTYLQDLADPSETVHPNFHATYHGTLANIANHFEPETVANIIPVLGGEYLHLVEETIAGWDLSDLDMIRGQTMRQEGVEGEVTSPAPEGDTVVSHGTHDVDDATVWLTEAGLERLSDYNEYRLFGPDEEEVTQMEGFAVSEPTFVFANRAVTTANPESVLQRSVDTISTDAEPVRDVSPLQGEIVDELTYNDFMAAAAFELVAERPDTGQAEYDGVIASLRGAGVSLSVGEQTTTHERVLRYRRGDSPDVSAIESALELAQEGNGPVPELADEWTVSVDDPFVIIESEFESGSLRETPEAVHAPLPVPGYESMFVPINPLDLGREPIPRVLIDASLEDDGRITVMHADGVSVEELTVSYTHEGERLDEHWEGPLEPTDSYTTEQPVDPGTQLRVRWAVGTENETVLAAIDIPADQ